VAALEPGQVRRGPRKRHGGQGRRSSGQRHPVPDWERLGDALRRPREAAAGRLAVAPLRAKVVSFGAGRDRSLVRITAPDQLGLLWAISDWFARHGVSIESLDASTTDGVAHDVFLVSGSFAAADLSRDLSSGIERCRVKMILDKRPRVFALR
jgi:UTP:GlnB (protein PII) uridylyltransferase